MRLLIFLFIFSLALAVGEFAVVPGTVGIGLQKNFDTVVFNSSNEKRCIMYHLGNPWAANVTGWIEIEGELSEYFIGNEPEELFVPSGTFRYNSSCCLLPMNVCFKFPYVPEDTYFTGKVSANFRADGRRTSGTGSATGSSVAYTLKVHIKPISTFSYVVYLALCFLIGIIFGKILFFMMYRLVFK